MGLDASGLGDVRVSRICYDVIARNNIVATEIEACLHRKFKESYHFLQKMIAHGVKAKKREVNVKNEGKSKLRFGSSK